MVYLLEGISLFSLIIEYERVDIVSLASLWNEYSGLVAIMSLALMSTVSLDQFSFLRGKFPHSHEKAETGESLLKQPVIQLLKYQFFGGTHEEFVFLRDANKLGSLRFFLYNLWSTLIWLSVIFVAGMVLRYLITYQIGRYGPVEFEAIVGILTIYLSGLSGLIIFKKTKAN